MKKYLLAAIVTLSVVVLYRFVNIRLFNLGIVQVTREHFFKLVDSPLGGDQSIVILNTGRLEAGELNEKIDSLLACRPAVVGINPCHLKGDVDRLKALYIDNKKVVIANCSGEEGILSRIINAGNSVTHFRHDKESYFEYKVDFAANPPFHQKKIAERKREVELINFLDVRKNFHRYDLRNVPFPRDFFEGKTVLIGYLGDYVTDSTYYFDEYRITPMNEYYGSDNIEPDLYDTEISAVIVRQLGRATFINEMAELPRILILFLICIVNILALTFVKTRWPALNVIIAFAFFLVINVSAGWFILYLFVKGYYLNLDELPLTLLITTVFTVGLAIFERRKAAQSSKTNK